MNEKILIIEDEIEILDDLTNILRRSNYDVISTNNATEGLNIVNNDSIDLILCDILLPIVDGYEFLKKLQEHPETVSIPFLFLSAKSNKFSVREAMNLGADDFISKPYDIDELLNTISIRLEKKKRRESHLSQKIENLQSNLRKTMPHEIRTPLNVILGFSEFLMKNTTEIKNDEAIDMLNNIHESGKRLLHTFENHLLLANLELILASRDERTKFLKHKTYMIDIFINDVINSVAIKYDRENDIRTKLDSGAVNIYEEHFRNIITEIVDNSFKFSEKGTEIFVESTFENGYCKISVIDNGRGMTENQIKSLDEFVQLERTTYEQQGTGIGLSIVKRVLDIYKGEFAIESMLNEFTKVTIKLPGKSEAEI